MTYRLGAQGHGPTSVSLNGAPLRTTTLTNPYRRPGVSVDLAEVLTALGDGPCTLHVETS